jgi:hypothetical protein
MKNLEIQVSNLDSQLVALMKKRNALSGEMRETPTNSDRFTELMNLRTDCDNRMKAIDEQVVLIKNRIRIAEEDKIKAQKEAERQRKLDLAAKITATVVYCPKCNSLMTWDGPKFDLPIHETTDVRKERNGWSRWWVVCACPRRFCGFGQTVFPDKPGPLELKKHRKSLTDGYLPTVVG